MLAHLPVLRQTTRLGGTIDEQIAEDSIERLGEPGKRASQGMGLGIARVYAEVSSLATETKKAPLQTLTSRHAGRSPVLRRESAAVYDGWAGIRCLLDGPEDERTARDGYLNESVLERECRHSVSPHRHQARNCSPSLVTLRDGFRPDGWKQE